MNPGRPADACGPELRGNADMKASLWGLKHAGSSWGGLFLMAFKVVNTHRSRKSPSVLIFNLRNPRKFEKRETKSRICLRNLVFLWC